MSRKPKRIDPPDCGCTDCLTGYSAPLSSAEDVVFLLLSGRAGDATSGGFHRWLVGQLGERGADWLHDEFVDNPLRKYTWKTE